MDDVLRGYEWALDRYYDYLDVRNDDLRWVLSSRQYGRFIRADYFYRPVYTSGHHWYFRVYITYTNHNHFFFPRPYHYHTYAGGHYRTHYHDVSYYKGRYKHPAYTGSYRILQRGAAPRVARMLRAAPTLRAPIPLQRAAMRTPHAAARPVQRTRNAGKPGLPVCAILPGTPRAAVAVRT